MGATSEYISHSDPPILRSPEPLVLPDDVEYSGPIMFVPLERRERKGNKVTKKETRKPGRCSRTRLRPIRFVLKRLFPPALPWQRGMNALATSTRQNLLVQPGLNQVSE